VIPAGKRTILFEGGVSTDTVGNRVNTTVTSFESVQPKTGVLVPARTPTGAPAALQQGLGAATLGNTTATFDIVTLDAEGDELIILVTKDREAVWSFNTDDSLFRDFYSLPDVGIYVFSGSNP
jgi:activator of HSP90 ATPase